MTQHTAMMVIGIGTGRTITSARVRWPSGKTTALGKVAAGSRLTIREDERKNRGG
ncbi:MAG: ASPIC/UnbV domain-containing protein [Planctomycetota bacterium]